MLTTSTRATASGEVVVRAAGVLHAGTYRQLRDEITKAALGPATLVIVDVNRLAVPDDYAWAVLTSARWLVHRWPDVPIVVVCRNAAVRRRLDAVSVSRYVPVFASARAARRTATTGRWEYRRRARVPLVGQPSSIGAAQIFVRDQLAAWSLIEQIPAALTVTTMLVENALTYTGAGCDLRLEWEAGDLVVAVSDSSSALAVRRESSPGCVPSGLDIVAALCSRWSCIPTPAGKTVWAHIDTGDMVDKIFRLFP